jgi:hypothetical protein
MEPRKAGHFDLDITKAWLVWSPVAFETSLIHAHAKLSNCDMEKGQSVYESMRQQFMIEICNSRVMKRTANCF